jgi:transcriptional regulator with PAS, ATPase and Fis domain
LFGHERGAFTGASEAKPGLLEIAAGGTVFLDEIGEADLTIQARLR